MNIGKPLEEMIDEVTRAGFVMILGYAADQHICVIRAAAPGGISIEATSSRHLLIAVSEAYARWQEVSGGSGLEM